MNNFEIKIDELQNKINNQHKIYKTVLYSTLFIVGILLIYICLQLLNIL